MTSLGFRILSIAGRPDRKLIAEFARMVTPHLSDSMERLQGGGPTLGPMYDGATMAGAAFTVRVPPGDNLLVHKALDSAAPGDVIVVDAGGVCEQAIIGEQMAAHAATRGIAGMVIFGAIRDSAELGAGDFPVFACGISHRGPYKNGPGEINIAISIGGMVVHPGDIMVGDHDGLVAVPLAQADEVLASAKAILARETANLVKIRAGTADRSWVDKALREKGYKL